MPTCGLLCPSCGFFRAVPSPHGCSVFYPLQEEDPDSESEKLVVREPEDEDGEC